MGFGGISFWQLAIILAIVILIFGTKKLRNVGGDLGGALKNFRTAMRDGENEGENRNEDGGDGDNASPKKDSSQPTDESHRDA